MTPLLSGIFVIDDELYEDLTGEEDLRPSERGDYVLAFRMDAPGGEGSNTFVHLRRGMSDEEVAEGLRAAADAIEDW